MIRKKTISAEVAYPRKNNPAISPPAKGRKKAVIKTAPIILGIRLSGILTTSIHFVTICTRKMVTPALQPESQMHMKRNTGSEPLAEASLEPHRKMIMIERSRPEIKYPLLVTK
jgi:hypothetical protein